MKLNNNVFFITGGTGYLGSSLVKTLGELNCKIYVLTRKYSNDELLNVIYINNDFSNLTDVPDDVEVIINCAGVINQIDEMEKINVECVKILCEICVKKNIKLVHISSVGSYGVIQDSFVDENTKSFPKSAYEISKLKGEQVLENYLKEGLKYNILQPSIIIGKKRANNKDAILTLSKLIKKNLIFKINSGEGIYNLIHIDEVITGIIILSNCDDIFGQKYILNENICFNDFFNIVKMELGNNTKTYSLPIFFIKLINATNFLLKYILPEFSNKIKNIMMVFKLKRMYSSNKFKNQFNYEPKKNIEEYISFMTSNYINKGEL